MKSTVYLETSIISYLAARPSRDLIVAAHQEATHEWWTEQRVRFDLFVSDLVVEEISAGNAEASAKRLEWIDGIERLHITPESIGLARDIIACGALPARAQADAVHISLAALNGLDYLLTWNMRHIANADVRESVRQALMDQEIVAPKLCTPLEFIGDA